MSRMLNVCEHLLNQGKTLQQLGRSYDALTVFHRLSSFRELPSDIAEETQARLAEIQLDRRKPVKARRHLLAALAYNPNNAHYHYVMATALRVAKDDPEQEERAEKHYRRSLDLNPDQLDCLADFGLFNLRRGHTDEGLASLREAWQKSEDPKYLAKLVRGFRLSGKWKEARNEIRQALFRHPRDRRFRKLYNDFRYLAWCRKQRRQQKQAQSLVNNEPVILKFPTTEREPKVMEVEGKIIRKDSASTLSGPRHATPRPDQRHVQ